MTDPPSRGSYQILINKLLKSKYWGSWALWSVAPLGSTECKITAFLDARSYNTDVSEEHTASMFKIEYQVPWKHAVTNVGKSFKWTEWQRPTTVTVHVAPRLTCLSWRWRKDVPPKPCYLYNILHEFIFK